jgi:DNA adenine methylase
MSSRVPCPLKWHGGKFYLAADFHRLAPPHIHRTHAYAGGLGEFWNWPHDGVSEVVNDIDGALTNFWRVLQGEDTFNRFMRIVQAMPFSQVEWQDSLIIDPTAEPVQRAVHFFVRVRQSMSGRKDCFAPISRNRVRRAMNEQASAWLSAVDGLPMVHHRLKRVVILNMPAIDAIQSQDGRTTLHYVDAPYVLDTRVTVGEYGLFEMTDDQHRELIRVLLSCEGKVMVSMYHHPIYDVLHLEHGWQVHEFDLPNNASAADVKERKIECVWCNFILPQVPAGFLQH